MKLSKILSMKISQGDNVKLNFQILDKAKILQFNLDKKSSNLSTNQLVLNSLIGTLVKYGPSGRIEPYLAESWEISSDRKTWKFRIREHLFCEDGEEISAQLFHKSLIESLKEYRKQKSAIMFDYLIGWGNFLNGTTDELEGIRSYNNILEFQFIHYPDEILELLRMPYFGLWRFDENNKLVSTSAYSLREYRKDKILLSLRKGWFSSSQNSFEEVEISLINSFNTSEPLPQNTILQIPFNDQLNNSKTKSYWIQFPPTLLEAFVLSPFKENFFNNQENRQKFLNNIRSLPKNVIRSNDFYPSAASNSPSSSKVNFQIKGNENPLTFILERSNSSEEELTRINYIITKGLEGSGMKYQIITRNLNDESMMEKIMSNRSYDARISAVNIGAYPVYTAIKMMFCTKLGITFPGHEERFCEIIEENLTKGNLMNQSFIDQFNESLNNEAIIIPIDHKSQALLASNNLDPAFLPPTSPYPLFEMLKGKEGE